MDDDDLAQLLAFGRAGIGVAMIAAPGLVAGSWVGFSAARSTAGRTLARALGARELALGLGLKRALDSRRGVREWAGAGVIADGADLAITLVTPGIPLPGRLGILGAASTGVAIGARIVQNIGSRSK